MTPKSWALEAMRRILVSISLFLLVVVSSGLIFSQTQKEIKLFVSPEMFELKVERGEKIEDKIRIYNKSEIPIPIEVKVTNFGAQEDSGTITFFESPTQNEEDDISYNEEDDISYNARWWIKIKNPNFILDPNEKEEVEFTIEVPANAEIGGKYAVALFEPRLPSYYYEKEATKVLPIVGVLFLLSVETAELSRPTQPLTIVEFAIPEQLHLKKIEKIFAHAFGIFSEAIAKEEESFSIVETSRLPFSLKIRNDDIYHLKPFGTLEILNGGGKVIETIEIPKTTILPGKTRKFPVEFEPEISQKIEKYLPAAVSNFVSQNLLLGKYQARLTLTTENGNIKNSTIIEQALEFWVFPWKIALLIIALVIIIVLLRKRLVAATRALLRYPQP